MEVRAGNRQIGKAIANYSACVREFGPDLAARLFKRLKHIELHPTLAHVEADPLLQWHALTGSLKGFFAFRLAHRERVICSLKREATGIIIFVEEISRDHYQDL